MACRCFFPFCWLTFHGSPFWMLTVLLVRKGPFSWWCWGWQAWGGMEWEVGFSCSVGGGQVRKLGLQTRVLSAGPFHWETTMCRREWYSELVTKQRNQRAWQRKWLKISITKETFLQRKEKSDYMQVDNSHHVLDKINWKIITLLKKIIKRKIREAP